MGTTNIAGLFRMRRRELDLTVRQVAERAGYDASNISKGMRKYAYLEEYDRYFPRAALRDKFARALEIPPQEVTAALEADLAELDMPVEPYLIVRYIPAVYGSRQIPDRWSRERAVKVLRRFSNLSGWSCCLVLSRIRGIYFWPDAEPKECYGLPSSQFLDTLHSAVSAGTDHHVQEAMRRHREEIAARGRPPR